MTTVLLVDDELPILRALRTGLRARGLTVVSAQTAEDGMRLAALDPPDAIVLDLGLPDLDGVEVSRRLREWTDLPIVVLSADGNESRKVEALNAGADDYITKPFGMAELEARLRVAFRHGARRSGERDSPILEVGPLRIDQSTREATVSGSLMGLTAKEFDFLAYLARHAGRVLTHRAILEDVWGPDQGSEVHYLRVYANRLRRKLGDAAGLLRTNPGVGYQLVDAPLMEKDRGLTTS